MSLSAATNDLTSTLQKGLFEEEANHNLEAAAAAYQAVSTQFDKDRKLAATAIFRLGEVYRKQGKTNEAVAQYERIVREFSDQETLATLSRQNLAQLGRPNETLVGREFELARLIAELRNKIASAVMELERIEMRKEKDPKSLPSLLSTKDLTLMTLLLLRGEKERRLAALNQSYATDHPEVKAAQAELTATEESVSSYAKAVMAALQSGLESLRHGLAELEKKAASEPIGGRSVEEATLVTDDEEKGEEIRRLQRALFQLRWPTKTPEQVRRQIEAARTAQQQKLDAATDQMESLRISLSVPDDIAVMDADKGMDDPRLVEYRAYFEAKSTRDGVRRFGQVLYGKLATEEIELDLLRQHGALD